MTTETKKYGIETVKKHLQNVFDISKDVKNALKNDGKISGLEIFAFLPYVTKVQRLINDHNILLTEIKDLDKTEVLQLSKILEIESKELFDKYLREIELLVKAANFLLETYEKANALIEEYKNL